LLNPFDALLETGAVVAKDQTLWEYHAGGGPK
jgi:hypothetical protein